MSDDFKTLKENFYKVTKRVLKEKLSKNPDTRQNYVIDLIDSYNRLINYALKKKNTVNKTTFEKVVLIVINLRERLTKCFIALEIQWNIDKDVLALVSLENLESHPGEANADTAEDIEIKYDELHDSINEDLNDLEKTLNFENAEYFDSFDTNILYEMDEMKVVEILSRIFTHTYDGNPVNKETFLGQIRLAKTIIKQHHPAVFLEFVKSRLSGKGLEHGLTAATVDEIYSKISEKIKPENSDVVYGKIMALRADNKAKTEFSKMADELAESLRLAYISEGIPHEKSNVMTVKATVSMCRNNARSDLVKSVLASSHFQSPSEVLAKYLVEIDTERTEKQVSAYRAGQNKNWNARNNNSSWRKYSGNRNNNGGQNRGNFNKQRNWRNNGNWRNNTNNAGNYSNNQGRFKNNYPPNQNVRVLGNEEWPTQGGQTSGDQSQLQ